MEWRAENGNRLRLMRGDITRVPADAIVNAANSALAGGGGVDGAIHRAAGPVLRRELDQIRAGIGHCPTGSAVVTTAGALPARFVFHAVGPIYCGGAHGEAELLAACYRKCLELAEERELAVIAFPSISTGAYGYPVEEAAGIAIEEVRRHLERPGIHLREAVFVLFDQAAYDAYLACLPR
ncbi:MAG TPA: O-acetyl-ADP-ribose deacetylase [Bryobacteraceae bacterium]|nr:O-acetyl-ADP-ribose deacetylase [Bryobacteraceae bacterium]